MRNRILIVAAGLKSRFDACANRIFCTENNKPWTKKAAWITFPENIMPLSFFARKMVVCLGLVVATPVLVFGQAGFAPEGGEFSLAGSLAGDQVYPAASLNASGGYLVWEDNVTDGDGQGISARRIDSSLSGSLSVFRVNANGVASQERPKVAVLDGGGAVFVWQGGPSGNQQIYARFLSSSNTWLTGDVLVNAVSGTPHQDASVAKLSNGNIVVVWSSWDQDGSMQGVFAQMFSPAGAKIGGEFQVNQTTALNQRTPVVAGLSDGNFVVVWASEAQLTEFSFDVSIFARLFNAGGVAQSLEFRANTGTNVCANPSVAAASDGGFMIAWGEKDVEVANNSWDVFGRTFSNAGTGGTIHRLNTVQYGDQVGPKVAALGSRYLAVWDSLGQDGSWWGVYGQFLQGNGLLAGGEFRVNSTIVNRQMLSAVAGNGSGRFLTVWTGFIGGTGSFDLFGQRYVDDSAPLPAPGSPFVTALSSTKLSVTWPAVGGFNVANYQLYIDGASTPVSLTSNVWVNVGNYIPNSTHTYRLAYVLTDGRSSPLSLPASGMTWGYDDNFDGLPDDWEELYWGSDPSAWPSPNIDSDGDGVSNRNEFLAGTNPADASSVLRTTLETTSQGLFLKWNSQPGAMYQVQASPNATSWTNTGGPRFALDHVDSINVGGSGFGFYRIVRLR